MSVLPYLKNWISQLGCERVTDSSEGLTCCCPFHKDNKPSFTINGKTGLWLCWSANCPYGQGNLVQFLVYAFGMSVSKALAITEDLPILVDLETIRALPPWEKRNALEQDEVMREGLLGLYSKCPKYLLRRGFTKAILKEFQVGYDPLTDYAVIPCRDLEGRLVGISKRACSEQEPKWVHENFSKGNIVYNAERARWDRTTVPFKKAEGIVVEGQLDCMWMVQHGWLNTVSTLSANVTSTQVDILSRCFSAITVFFDNDEGGFTGAYYLAKKLHVRVPTYVVSYPVSEDGSKVDPSRLTANQIHGRLNAREEALEFIQDAAPLVEYMREQKMKKRLSNRR